MYPQKTWEIVPKEIKRNTDLYELVVFWYEKQIKDIFNDIYY